MARGRPKLTEPGRKVEPILPADAHACLVRLAQMGRFGATKNDVARYMILREIDRMTTAGLLPRDPFLAPDDGD